MIHACHLQEGSNLGLMICQQGADCGLHKPFILGMLKVCAAEMFDDDERFGGAISLGSESCLRGVLKRL